MHTPSIPTPFPPLPTHDVQLRLRLHNQRRMFLQAPFKLPPIQLPSSRSQPITCRCASSCITNGGFPFKLSAFQFPPLHCQPTTCSCASGCIANAFQLPLHDVQLHLQLHNQRPPAPTSPPSSPQYPFTAKACRPFKSDSIQVWKILVGGVPLGCMRPGGRALGAAKILG